MPELPEVETITRDLKQFIVGQTIDQIFVLKEKSFIGDARYLIDQKICGISRCGKMIVLELTNKFFLVIHLKMTGQLIFQKFRISSFGFRDSASQGDAVGGHPDKAYQKQTQLPHKYTRVWFLFASGDKLFFNDLRIFGWIKSLTLIELEKEQAKIGFDALDFCSFSKFVRFITRRRIPRSLLRGWSHHLWRNKEYRGACLVGFFISRYPNRLVKDFLQDQKIIAGIGNIYASEILFDANILPTRKVKNLTKTEQTMLLQSIDKILLKAIKYGGTSSSDYRRPDGSKGGYLDHAFVYAREGERCKKCPAKIKRQKIGQRSAFFCSQCQK